MEQSGERELRRSSRETSKANAFGENNTVRMAQQFIGNFDPETSARERRKLSRKINNNTKTDRRYTNAVYDERGIHIKTGKDVCDCLKEKCPGCFFPCPKCRSPKCGTDCRVFRKYYYDLVEFEGTDYKIKSPFNVDSNNSHSD